MEVNISEAREKFSELVNEVAFGKKRIVVSRRGKPLAVLVPIDGEDHKAIKPESNKAIEG